MASFNWSIVSMVFFITMAITLGGVVLSAVLHLANARRRTWRSDIIPYSHRVVRLWPLAGVLLAVMLAFPQATFPWYGTTGKHVNAWHNYGFLVGREVVAFIVVALVNIAFVRASDHHERGTGGEPARMRLTYWASAVVTLFVLYASLIAWDFEMTLTPGWRSAMYGPNVFVSFVHAFFAIFILAMFVLRQRSGARAGIADTSFNALAQLMLGFTLLWIYTFFGQFLTIWYANLPEETFRLHTMMFERADIRRGPGEMAVLFWSFLLLKSFIPFFMLIFAVFRLRPELTVIPAACIAIGSCIERYTWAASAHTSWNIPLTTLFDIGVTLAVLVAAAIFLRRAAQRSPSPAGVTP